MGGMPGMGRMPGMGGGLPALLASLFSGAGAGGMPRLPGGITPQQAGMGAIALFFILPRLGIGMIPMLLLGGAGAFVYKSASDGKGARGVLTAGREVLDKVGGAIGRATGSAVSASQTLALLAAALFLVYRYVLSSDRSGGAAGGFADGGYSAYSKGFQDGQNGNPYEPIADPAPSGGGGGGWGIGKLFNLAMAGSMVYQMGGQPWSLPALVANARTMNPMNMMIMFQLLSSIFF